MDDVHVVAARDDYLAGLRPNCSPSSVFHSQVENLEMVIDAFRQRFDLLRQHREVCASQSLGSRAVILRCPNLTRRPRLPLREYSTRAGSPLRRRDAAGRKTVGRVGEDFYTDIAAQAPCGNVILPTMTGASRVADMDAAGRTRTNLSSG